MTFRPLRFILRIVRRGPLAAAFLLAATPRAPGPELYAAGLFSTGSSSAPGEI